MRLLGQTRKTAITLKFLTEKSTEDIIAGLDRQNLDFGEPESVTIRETCTTVLTNRVPREDYTSESLESQVRYPSYRGSRP